MRDDVLPATFGLTDPAPGVELNFVRAPAPSRIDRAMVTARGFDGFNTALVIGRFTE
jgi:minimal PKS chain-length factor (CLF/KS beta)